MIVQKFKSFYYVHENAEEYRDVTNHISMIFRWAHI